MNAKDRAYLIVMVSSMFFILSWVGLLHCFARAYPVMATFFSIFCFLSAYATGYYHYELNSFEDKNEFY